MRRPIDLSRAGPGAFRRVKPKWLEALWMCAEAVLVTNPLQPSSRIRRAVLRVFGARIGQGVIVRPRVRVKFPWNLCIGDRSWIGEGVWIHNQAILTVGSDCVLSQEAFITTGSHDTQVSMDLMVSPVSIQDGAWITARAIVLKGVTVGCNAILTPGSVASEDLPADMVARGNPARPYRPRWR